MEGMFHVSLTAVDQNGCSNALMDSNYIEVFDVPIANFLVDSISANCPPLPVTFSDASTTIITSWSWDFGDGNTSTLNTPSHIYSASGNYDVLLNVTNENGCSDTYIVPAFINVGGPTGSFTFQPDSGCTNLQVEFTKNTNYAISYTWDFGDGLVVEDSIDTIIHLFESPGIYTPQLVLEDSTGCIFVSNNPNQIYMDRNIPDFNFGDSLQCHLDTVSFANLTSTFFPVTYNWTFGDGNTSSDLAPIHYFDTSGIYSITLTTANEFCVMTSTHVLDINAAPDLDINWTNTSWCPPLKVVLSAINSTPEVPISQWLWDFGNGGVSNNNLDSTIYNTAGNFLVMLSTFYADGKCKIDSSTNVEILEWPIANFNYSPDIPYIGNSTIEFSNLSTFDSQWYWDFDDGSSDLSQNPIYTYSEEGEYNVTLYVSNVVGCTDSISKLIFIAPISDVLVPTVFTPNGDGKNDYFNIISDGLSDFHGEIFNRWGELIFTWNTIEEGGWDGVSIAGIPAPEGTYFVIITATGYDGQKYLKTGSFMLQR